MNSSRSNIPDTLFLLTVVLTFYCLGAAFVESFVNYRTWGLIGAGEFRAYHQALSPLIIRMMVVPIAVKSLFVLLLLWFRPAGIPKWAIILAVIFELINWASTIAIQIPIQIQLSETGNSTVLLEKLIATDWIRKITSVANAVLFFWLLATLFRTKSPGRPDEIK